MISTITVSQEQSMVGQAEQCRRLAQVLTLTRQMLALAEEGEWEQVAERELDRREDLATCFSDTRPAADAELIAEAMATLLHLNEELMAKLKIARADVMAQGREYNRQRSAAGSYREIADAR